ncbi:PCNA-associated factor isoform X2 [Calonectris borealis]|uniref:PCNA-associated factor isoform X2 n=1 Tax=Calonectris borealis TaxID=1323832 RepID=UPI003F4B7B16
MVRTKAACGGAYRKGVGRRVGGNPVCVRPVPAWQRGIGEFLQLPQKENRAPGGEAAGSSGLGPAAKNFGSSSTSPCKPKLQRGGAEGDAEELDLGANWQGRGARCIREAKCNNKVRLRSFGGQDVLLELNVHFL